MAPRERVQRLRDSRRNGERGSVSSSDFVTSFRMRLEFEAGVCRVPSRCRCSAVFVMEDWPGAKTRNGASVCREPVASSKTRRRALEVGNGRYASLSAFNTFPQSVPFAGESGDRSRSPQKFPQEGATPIGQGVQQLGTRTANISI